MVMLLLAAVNEGLATGFAGPPQPQDRDELAALLGMPQGIVPIGIALIGHGAKDAPLPGLDYRRRPLEEVLHLGHW
jgi:nitroreductase